VKENDLEQIKEIIENNEFSINDVDKVYFCL
jgi:hypothetical protein